MASIAPEPGSESIHRLLSSDLPQWLTPNAEFNDAARAASRHVFSALKPYASKSPFERLLTDGFDDEQIWQQIDLQSQPLLSRARREVKRLQKEPTEIRLLDVSEEGEEERKEKMEIESEGFEEEIEEFDEELDDEEDGDDDDEEEEKEDGEEGDNTGTGIEDKFLKIKDLEEFLEDDEAREYGSKKKKSEDTKKKIDEEEEEDDEEEEEGDDEDDSEDELGAFGLDGNEDEDDQLGNAR